MYDDLDTVEIIAHSAKRSDVSFRDASTVCCVVPRLSFTTRENVSRCRGVKAGSSLNVTFAIAVDSNRRSALR